MLPALTPATASAAPAPAQFLVGISAVNIDPLTPVTMAAYGGFRVNVPPYVQPNRHFYARSLAISSIDGAMAHTVVLTVLDSQGYFIAYKQDPLSDPGYYGTAGIRKQVQADRGLDPEHVIIATSHTHNSPDSIGVWGGGQDPHNVAYLGLVRRRTIESIELALGNRAPATFSVGVSDARQYQDTLDQVRGNPSTYPMDRLMRVLQAHDSHGGVVATLINYGVHGTVLGPEPVLSPDWTGEVAYQLDRRWGPGTTIVVPGAVGRTWPAFPDPHLGNNWEAYLATYGRLLVGRVDAALARTRPVVDGTVGGAGAAWSEPVTDPAAYALLTTQACIPGANICGTMRSLVPPYYVAGGVIETSDLNAFRVGDLFIGGAPGEAYPEVATELQSRVLGGAVCGDSRHVFALSLTNDQVGYTTTSDEYLLAVDYAGDEGIFAPSPVIGNDVINGQLANARKLGLATGPDYDGATAGPLAPPPNRNTQAPPFVDSSGPAPSCATRAASAGGGDATPVAAPQPASLPPTATVAGPVLVGTLRVLIALLAAVCCGIGGVLWTRVKRRRRPRAH
jgi:hypothetical protein